jgi:hypothetical protein
MNGQDKLPAAPGTKGHDSYIILGIAVYLMGFFFLSFVGNNYTGVMSFLAPASILTGALIIVIGLLF